MIMHLAPRRVSLVSKNDAQQGGIPLDLNTLLAVDLQTGQNERVRLVVRLTDGTRVIACTYAEMAEAGPDCGRLRILAGLPAWCISPDTPTPTTRQPHPGLFAATAACLLIATMAALGLAMMSQS
jgi:hypothetical protein